MKLYLRLEVEDSKILEHLVSLLYHINEQAVLGAAATIRLLDSVICAGGGAVRGQVGKDVPDLRVERGAHRLSLQQRRHAARVFVAESVEFKASIINGADLLHHFNLLGSWNPTLL